MTGAGPVDLQVNYRESPKNAPTDDLRFSWRLPQTTGGRQSAYRVIVGRTGEAVTDGNGDQWDSGKVESQRSVDVKYQGPRLSTDTTYRWAVQVWDGAGESTPFSSPARFSTGLEYPEDWRGDWIGHQPDGGDSNGYRSAWQCAEKETTPEWVTLDLGGVQEIDSIELYPAGPFDQLQSPEGFDVAPVYSSEEVEWPLQKREHVWGFGFPVRYRIEIADDPDFSDARTVVDRSSEDQPNPGSKPVVHEASERGRYVRLTATRLDTFDPKVADQLVDGSESAILGGSLVNPDRMRRVSSTWSVFAMGAIAVRNSRSEDLARSASVGASSSVETQTWGLENLVDGNYGPTLAATSPLLRAEFQLSKPVKRARLHVSTLGAGEAYLNGERIGEDLLAPAWTPYDGRILYETYEVGGHLSVGTNAIALWLGRGFFSKSALIWTGYGSPRALVQLNIEFADGSTREVISDGSWRGDHSPVVANDVFDGEQYDARLEQPGWANQGFHETSWEPVTLMEQPGGDLVPQRCEHVQVTERFKPRSLDHRDDGVIVDFGQNLTGWVELTIRNASLGSKIRIEHAEILDETGELSTVDLADANATDLYIANGSSAATYEPRFTYHGFQFARISGHPGELDPGDIVAKAVHTNFQKRGHFDCSNDDLRAVQHAAEWTIRGNSMGIPTDCPQRAERCGWTCDTHLSAAATLYNFDAVRFFEKWLRDLDVESTPEGCVPDTAPFAHGCLPGDPSWTMARVKIPWKLYQIDGDRSVLEEHYEGMRGYVDFWHEQAEDHLLPAKHGIYGDWLALEFNHEAESRVGEPVGLFNSASHYRSTQLLAQIAETLGCREDAERYTKRAAAIADAFNDRYLDTATCVYEPGSQAANAIPLHFGITPVALAETVAGKLAKRVREADGERVKTGLIGTGPLIHALADHGHEDLAYTLVSQPECPGWVYMVNHAVTTTLWERWNSDEAVGAGMNSFNHLYRASISEWFYKHLAGIQFTGEGHTVIRPVLGEGLEWAEGEIETRHGLVSSRWEREAEEYQLSVTIPWNTEGEVCLPMLRDSPTVRNGDGEVIWKDGRATPRSKRYTEISRTGGRIVVGIDDGTHLFTVG